MSRSWVETEISGLEGGDRAIARLALVLAKAPYQVDAGLVQTALRENADQVRFIRILAWCSYQPPVASVCTSRKLRGHAWTASTMPRNGGA